MAIVVVNQGEEIILQNALNKAASQDWKLKLFQNNITPAETDTEANYTEATFTGYAAVTLTGASWSTVQGNPTSATYAQQTFTSTAGSQNQTIYGVYYVQATSGKLIAAELFSSPVTIVNNGDQIKWTPQITGE